MALKLMLILGAMFSLLAGTMAFLITYNEYSKHFKDRRKAVLAALQTAVVAFLFFVALSLVAGLVLGKVFAAGA